MKRMKQLFIIMTILISTLSGCNTAKDIENDKLYSGETVNLKKLYRRNKKAATEFSNYFIYNGKHVDQSSYYNYKYYSYLLTPNYVLNLPFRYKGRIDLSNDGEKPQFVACYFSSTQEAFQYCKYICEYKNTTTFVRYKNIIYTESYFSYSILFGVPKQENREYYAIDGEDRIFIGFTEQKFHEVSDVKMLDGYTKTYGYSFNSNKNITRVETNKELVTIGAYTFINCLSLNEVVLNDGLKHICDMSFLNCTSLKKVIIPYSVENIHIRAFYNCDALETVIIPKNVAHIGEEVFNYGNIYCESKSRPSGWHKTFATGDAKVYWADEWEYDENGEPRVK